MLYVMVLSLCFGFVGFLDDYAKMKKKQNEGLTSKQKMMLQLAVSALFLYVMYRTGNMRTDLYVPFFTEARAGVGTRTDPDRNTCRYCHINLADYPGSTYSWIVDPINNPWKITCPACKRDFPSNDFGAYYENRHLHLEGEFLRKFYENGISEDVNAYNMMAIYRHKLKNCYFQDISYLLRYDYMGDYADGKSIPMVTEDGVSVWNGEKVLLQNQHERHRVTAGVTFHLKYKTFNTDLRLNYENYFYRDNAVPKIAEQDKIVAELMVRF